MLLPALVLKQSSKWPRWLDWWNPPGDACAQAAMTSDWEIESRRRSERHLVRPLR